MSHHKNADSLQKKSIMLFDNRAISTSKKSTKPIFNFDNKMIRNIKVYDMKQFS